MDIEIGLQFKNKEGQIGTVIDLVYGEEAKLVLWFKDEKVEREYTLSALDNGDLEFYRSLVDLEYEIIGTKDVDAYYDEKPFKHYYSPEETEYYLWNSYQLSPVSVYGCHLLGINSDDTMIAIVEGLKVHHEKYGMGRITCAFAVRETVCPYPGIEVEFKDRTECFFLQYCFLGGYEYDPIIFRFSHNRDILRIVSNLVPVKVRYREKLKTYLKNKNQKIDLESKK